MKNVRKLFVIVVFAFVAVAAFSQEIKDGVLTIKDGTTEIKWSAYKDNTEITKVIIPSSVTKIEKLAFQNCANLTEIDIPSSVKTIGDAAFQNCTSLTKVTLHEGLTNFSFRLFKNTAIREITIPSSVMEFGKEVFNDCKKLAAIWVDKNSQAYNFYKDDYRLLIIGESSQNDIKPITTTTKYGDKIQNGVLYIADGTTEIKSNAYTGNDEITKVIIPSSVTKIEKLAFQNCANLTEIEIPSSVETIGEAAFQNCTSLTKVMLPEGLTKLSFRLFKGSGIPEITIPASVAEIGGEVLEECKNLTAINVTKDSQAYAVYKFDSRVVVTGESSLTDENITQTTQIASNQSEMQPTTTVTEYGDTIENGVLYIKDGTTEIKSKAYYKEKEITKVVIPSTVTKIGSQAFSECVNLTEIDIPSSVKSIDNAAFQNCTKLTKVTLPEGLTTLSFRLFKGSGIPEITIPSSIKTIDIEVLADCKKLTAIKVIRDSKAHGFYSDDPRIKVIGDFSQTAQFAKLNKTTTLSNGDRIENGVLYIKSGTTQIKNKEYYANEDIKKVVIPSTVTKIGSQAFSECVNLTEIDIPSSVKTIGDAAFQNCIWLTKVSLPEGLTKLGYRLFKNTGVKKITIPSSVTEFANEVFTDCLNLTEIEIPSATTKFGTRIFGDCKNLTSIKVDKYTNAHACFSIYPGVSFTNKRPAQTKEQWMATSEYSILDDGVLYIANGITKIHDNEFRGLTDIKEIRFLDTTTKIAGIGTSAFRGCTGLKRVVIPGNVKTIGDWAFSYCSNLEEVVFEEGVENIVVYAFVGCPKLLSVYMPKSVKKLDIENIITEKRGERIFHCWLGSEACRIVLKHNCRIDVIGIDEANRDKIDLKQISISNTTIKAGLFKDLPYERIDISDNLTQIGKNAFNDKTVLRAKRNTAADKCIRANGYYLCGVLADLNTYTKDKSKEIKEDFTRILCDDDPYWRWSTYKFNTLEPLKLEEVDDKLVITSFMLYPCTNVTVTDKNGKVLMRNKTIHPFTRTDVCDFDFITDSVENYTLTSDDAFYNKLVSGKVKWNVSFSSFIRRESTRKDASSETMCPAYLREYIPGIFDFAYTIGSAEYESRCYEAVENKTLVTDEALTVPLTREQMEKLLKQTKSWSFIFGRDNIAGTGGGGVLTMTTDFILALSRGSPSAFWHEFSHCMGWAHEQGNMCFEGRPEPYNIDWPSIGSLVYQKQYKDGTLPYVFDRYSLNTYFFSGKEVFPAGVEADVIKDDTLYIGNGMPSTGSFKNNTSFTKVVLPSTVVQINGSAFYGTMINEFTIPENIVKIGNTAFHNCTELESIIIPNGVKQVGDAAFQNCMYLSTAKIGSGMRQLNYRLFKNSGLLSITIPGNIKYIGKEAFQDCKKLKSIVIEDGVRKIDDNAFNNTVLREIAIPASVTDIGKNITSKDVVWIVEKGSYAEKFALENNYTIKSDSVAAMGMTASELLSNAERILAESKNAASASATSWKPKDFTTKNVRRKWDFSSSLTGGDRGTVTFAYTGGAHMMCLSEALFMADDKPLAYFPEKHSAGASPSKITYSFDIPAGTKKLELYALARTDGGTDSNGKITVSIPDDGTIEGITTRILEESKNAASVRTDKWYSDTFTKSDVRRKWDFSSFLKGNGGGEYFVSFCYTDGGSSLMLSEALFVADGKPLARFFSKRMADKDSPLILYKLNVPRGTKKLELYALAKKSSDNTTGIISVETPESKVTAVMKNAVIAPNDLWERGTFTGNYVRRKWDFSSSLDGGGEYKVMFRSTAGDDLLLSDVVFAADGKLVSFSPAMRKAGGSMDRIVYFVNVPAGTKKLEMYGLVRNNKDDAKTEGEITVLKQ